VPKATPHFDALGLLHAVAQQDVGLRVTTNNPKRFREILYETCRAAPHLRCRIYANPRARLGFYLVKQGQAIPGAEELTEDATDGTSA
jgi:hypothetical protein